MSSGFSEHERYQFDLNGVIAIEDAISPELCARLNAWLDAEIEANFEGGAGFRSTVPDERIPEGQAYGATQRFGDFIRPDAPDSPYLQLVDNPRIAAYLDGMFSSGRVPPGTDAEWPGFRLDHMYLDLIMPPTSHEGGETTDGPIGTTLHKIGLPDAYYRNEEGRMYNGLLTVAYNLADVDPERDGGFACVPGSHKSSMDGYWRTASWKTMREDSGESIAPDIVRIGGKAGSAIIFTESLAHGTLPWKGSHARRTLFAKFNAHSMSYSHQYFSMETVGHLSDREQAILSSPSARMELLGRTQAAKQREQPPARKPAEKAVEETEAAEEEEAAAVPAVEVGRATGSGLEVGQRVQLHGLEQAEFNGRSGTVFGLTPEHVVVSLGSLDGRMQRVAVPEKHLRLLGGPPARLEDPTASDPAAAATLSASSAKL